MSPVFGHGRLRLYLLKLLEESPRHGYEVIRLLQDRFLGVYSPSPGTIYPRLARLEEEGLVTHEVVDGKKVYRITDKGRAELNDRHGRARRAGAGDHRLGPRHRPRGPGGRARHRAIAARGAHPDGARRAHRAPNRTAARGKAGPKQDQASASPGTSRRPSGSVRRPMHARSTSGSARPASGSTTGSGSGPHASPARGHVPMTPGSGRCWPTSSRRSAGTRSNAQVSEETLATAQDALYDAARRIRDALR